jgi:Ca2+-dependent lipid-binding protein
MAPMTIEVSVMAAEELHNTSKLGKMSVYTVLWVDPAMKKCTRVLHKIGKNPVWNDRMSLTLVNGDQTLVSYPQSTLTVQVSHLHTMVTHACCFAHNELSLCCKNALCK